jgi:hypothetical protein
MDNFLFLLFCLLIILLVIYCSDHKLQKKLHKEKELLKENNSRRNFKLALLEKRKGWKNLSKKSIIVCIAFFPFLIFPSRAQKIIETIQKLLFAIAVLRFNSSDHIQSILENLDRWLSVLFYGKIEKQIGRLEKVIIQREQKIRRIERKLATI